MSTPEERVAAATHGRPPGRAEIQLPDPERTYVTIREAMDLAGVKRRTVMGWFERGLLQRFKGPNGYAVLIDKLELQSYLFSRRKSVAGVAPVVIDGKPKWD